MILSSFFLSERIDQKTYSQHDMNRTESLPRILPRQSGECVPPPKHARRRRKIKKGGGGFVPQTEHGHWRSPGDSGIGGNILATQSEILDRPTPEVFNRSQTEMFIGDNNYCVSPLPPTQNEIKAESWPMDPSPPRMSRRPSVTFLPFAMRPLPLLQKKMTSNRKLLNIGTMRTTNQVNSRTKFRQTHHWDKKFQHQKRISAAGSYTNLWHDEKGSSNALLKRATQFQLIQMHKIQHQRQRRNGSRVNLNKFPGGFKRKHDSNAYYATSAIMSAHM